MKILYISCHEVLEFDELSMFADLGIEVFSVGAYLLPHRPFGESLRPPIPNLRVNADDLASYFSLVRPGDNPQKCQNHQQPVARFFESLIVRNSEQRVRLRHRVDVDAPRGDYNVGSMITFMAPGSPAYSRLNHAGPSSSDDVAVISGSTRIARRSSKSMQAGYSPRDAQLP